MNVELTSREIQRWYPQKWSQIAGNAEVIKVCWNFIVNGGCNMLFTGGSRTGKTRTISLLMKSMLCSDRQEMDPCGECASCRMFIEGRHDHMGLFAAAANSRYCYAAIDCGVVTAEQLKKLFTEINLESDRTLIYLDEVAELGRRGLEHILLKPIDESPCIWVASAITLRKRNRKGAVRKALGLSVPMLGRFAVKVGTSLPSQQELYQWILERCSDWGLTIDEPEISVPLMVERTKHHVGYVIQMLAVAVSRGRKLDPFFVTGFNLSSVD